MVVDMHMVFGGLLCLSKSIIEDKDATVACESEKHFNSRAESGVGRDWRVIKDRTETRRTTRKLEEAKWWLVSCAKVDSSAQRGGPRSVGA